ncbi:MAG TPA: hypothetical protein VNO75_12075 [Gemmatimonadaceae bacterium]|nr:hypothetical protein [Gemmatimonadaceae bacterium]
MRSRSVVILFCCLAAAVPLVSASAQSAPIETREWSLSLGLDPGRVDRHGLEREPDAPVVMNLSRLWQAPGSRFSRDISLMLGADLPRRTDPGFFTGCFECTMRISKTFAALTAGSSIDVFRVARFTPYFRGGTGVYLTRLSTDLDPGAAETQDPLRTPTGFAWGANAGFGIKARFRSREFFVEQMFHHYDLRRRDLFIMPLSFGVRF